MNAPIEIHHPRYVTDLANWEIGPLRLKVYGLALPGKQITGELISDGQKFARDDVLGRVNEEGNSNELGFVIIHPGTTGVSTTVHWWIEGCVLCQRIKRVMYETGVSLDTVLRPVIGCVWELAVVEAERRLWLEHMMGETADEVAYLNARAPVNSV